MSGGSKSQEQQQSTTTNTLDPQYAGMLQGNYATAQDNAAKLDQPYTGQLTAGFNPTQTQAQGILGQVGTDPSYQTSNNGAISSVQGILGSNPNTTVTPQTLAGTNLQPYENPYTTDVINASIAQNERARQIANMNDNQQATAAGAFGGSRSGVANALTNEAYDRNDQTNIANLNSANFDQARTAASTDISNNLNAQQSSIANKLAQQGLQINAAGQVVALNTANLNTAATQGGILGAVGDAQQQQQQTQLSNAYQAYMAGQQLTVEQQQLLNSALGLIPAQQTVDTTGSGTSSTSTSPGLSGILGGLGSLGMGLGKSGLGLALSDARVKSDVSTVGHDARGRRWVSFRYNWDPTGTQRHGVVAQELLRTDPELVSAGNDGLLRVDYGGLSRKEAA